MEQREKEKLMKTGTTTLGLVCKDGIILAADKRVSAGYMIAHKKFTKIIQVTDHIAITIAGLVSDAQLLSKLIKAEIKLKDIQTGRKAKVKEAANLLAGIVYSNIRKMSMVPGIVGFLLGGKDDLGYHLFNLGIDGSVTMVDDYTSDGSGSIFAIGVLETIYKKDMTVEEGVKVAVKAMNAALQRDMATGNGIKVITITDKGIKTVIEKEFELKVD
jgi:proteasome beta subunit